MPTETITKLLRGQKIVEVAMELNSTIDIVVDLFPEILKSFTIMVNLTAGASLTLTVQYMVNELYIDTTPIEFTTDGVSSYNNGTTPCFSSDSLTFHFVSDVSTTADIKVVIVYE